MSKIIAQRCTKCGVEKKLREFYASDSPVYKNTGRVPICKICLRKMAKENVSMETICRMIDKPYIASLWLSSMSDDSNPSKALSSYMRQINSLPQYKHMTYEHSSFDLPEDITYEHNNLGQVIDETISENEIARLQEKWGYGYTEDEYVFFEKKWDTLKGNYSVKTSLHEEALRPYIRFRVKEELATAAGDVKAAKDWAGLANAAATAAKINPNQLNPHDLTQGLDTISNITTLVEENVDIIPILPQFIDRPQDKGDFVLWCLVNYSRQTKGFPLCEYEEIYSFYEERRKEYEERERLLMLDDDLEEYVDDGENDGRV